MTCCHLGIGENVTASSATPRRLAGILRNIAVQWLTNPDGVDLGRATSRAIVIASHTYGGCRPIL
jgi:hypothetical protein